MTKEQNTIKNVCPISTGIQFVWFGVDVFSNILVVQFCNVTQNILQNRPTDPHTVSPNSFELITHTSLLYDQCSLKQKEISTYLHIKLGNKHSDEKALFDQIIVLFRLKHVILQIFHHSEGFHPFTTWTNSKGKFYSWYITWKTTYIFTCHSLKLTANIRSFVKEYTNLFPEEVWNCLFPEGSETPKGKICFRFLK